MNNGNFNECCVIPVQTKEIIVNSVAKCSKNSSIYILGTLALLVR